MILYHQPQCESTRELGVPLEVNETIWRMHYITFGVLYSIISLITLSSVLGFLRDDCQKKFRRRHYFLWINFALFYFSLVMTIALLADPYEDRRCLKRIIAREALHLFIRMRLPFLELAFSLLQLSLFSVTDLAKYATWFHNMVIVLIVSSIHFGFVIISSVVSMFTDASLVSWLICDFCMFLLFSGSSLISLYSVIKIMFHYHKVGSRNISIKYCSNHASFGDKDYITETINESKPSDEKENILNVTTNEVDRTAGIFSIPEIKNVCNAALNNANKREHHLRTKRNADKLPITKKASVYGETKSVNKIASTKRRIGSLPRNFRTSKFCDKSIRKVAFLMMIVAFAGLVMCVTIVISCSEVFQDEHMGPWEWYVLRTVRRISEIIVIATMAYLGRREISCC